MRRRIEKFSSDANDFHYTKKQQNVNFLTSLNDGNKGRLTMTRNFSRWLSIVLKLSAFVFLFWCSFLFVHQRHDDAGVEPNLISMTCPNTVIGMGSGYDLQTYQQFVGSLRSLGFEGTIILAVAKDSHPDVISYLSLQNVQMKAISTVKCSQPIKNQEHCIEGYDTIHTSWISFFLARSWLKDLSLCSSASVIIASIPHVKFVKDPFLNTHPSGQGLYLFQMPFFDTMNWRVAKPLHYCTESKYMDVPYDDEDDNVSKIKSLHFHWDVPLLSTSIIIGDLQSIFFVLDEIILTMQKWKQQETCPTHIHGTEMAILNYLYYNGDIYAHVHPLKTKKSMVHFIQRDNNVEDYIFSNESVSGVIPETASVLVGYNRDPISKSSNFLHSMVTEQYSMQDYTELTDFIQEER